jgi:hypothetical protein
MSIPYKINRYERLNVYKIVVKELDCETKTQKRFFVQDNFKTKDIFKIKKRIGLPRDPKNKTFRLH